MTKLTNKQIQDMLDLEKGNKTNYQISNKAHSKFSFEIHESITDLLNNIRDNRGINGLQNEEKKWVLIEHKDGVLVVNNPDLDLLEDRALVAFSKNKMSITMGQYKYSVVENKKSNGSMVEFSGPLNVLATQDLLPEMTYVAGTLRGKFWEFQYDKNNQFQIPKVHNLTPYLDIDTYCSLKDKIDNHYENEEDMYAYLVNRFFNNEINALPRAFETLQMERYRLMREEKDKIEAHKKSLQRENSENKKSEINVILVKNKNYNSMI